MTEELTQNIANSATGLAIASGSVTSYLGFLDEHAAGLGVVLTFFFGSVGIVFYYLNLKKLNKADDNEAELQRLRIEIASISQRQEDKGK
jgi:hypothetical protein